MVAGIGDKTWAELLAREEEKDKLLEGAAYAEDGVYRTPDGRDYMTVLHYPFKMPAEEFIKAITEPDTNQAFIENMKNLKSVPEEQYAEKWIQTYAAWMEMNE